MRHTGLLARHERRVSLVHLVDARVDLVHAASSYVVLCVAVAYTAIGFSNIISIVVLFLLQSAREAYARVTVDTLLERHNLFLGCIESSDGKVICVHADQLLLVLVDGQQLDRYLLLLGVCLLIVQGQRYCQHLILEVGLLFARGRSLLRRREPALLSSLRCHCRALTLTRRRLAEHRLHVHTDAGRNVDLDPVHCQLQEVLFATRLAEAGQDSSLLRRTEAHHGLAVVRERIYLVELILTGQSDPVRVLLQVGLGGGLAGVPSMLIIGKQLVARIVLRHTSRERIELIRRARRLAGEPYALVQMPVIASQVLR